MTLSDFDLVLLIGPGVAIGIAAAVLAWLKWGRGRRTDGNPEG